MGWCLGEPQPPETSNSGDNFFPKYREAIARRVRKNES